jgi:hypothetical protein
MGTGRFQNLGPLSRQWTDRLMAGCRDRLVKEQQVYKARPVKRRVELDVSILEGGVYQRGVIRAKRRSLLSCVTVFGCSSARAKTLAGGVWWDKESQ